MATIFADPGGEYYFSLALSGAVTAGIWSAISGGSSLSNAAPAGRQAASDGKYYGIDLGGAANTITKILQSNYSDLILGQAYYVSTGITGASVLLQYQDVGTNQCDLRVDASGHLQITRNGTQLGISTVIMPPGWNYIEFQVVFATGATGSAQCWLNGVSVISVSSVQTATSANAYANRFVITGIVSSCYIKDLVVLDATTGANTTHLGDVTVSVEYPNAAGVNQQWTPLSSTQVSQVQDGITHTGTWPDGDTTYIFDSTTNDISDFQHTALSLTGTVYAVVHATYGRKDDSGSRSFAQVCLSNGTTEVGATIPATNSYLYYFDYLDEDPHTSAQWTLTNYNNATFGVKEIT